MLTDQDKKTAWDDARAFWHYPKLPDPIYNSMDGIAAMNMQSKQICVNGKNLEEKVGGDLLSTIHNHEIGHYMLCPFSMSAFLVLIGKANGVVGNMQHAKLIQNLFSDLLVNYHLFVNGDPGIRTVYERIPNSGESWWNMYMSVWGEMISHGYGSLQKTKEVTGMANTLRNCVHRSKQWPDKIVEFAKLMSGTMSGHNIHEEQDGLIDSMDIDQFGPVSESELNKVRKQLRFGEYRGLLGGIGIGTESNVSADYYNMLAKRYQIFIPENVGWSGNVVLESPIHCEPEKALDADFEYSLSRFGVLNPNALSKWKFGEAHGPTESQEKKDLLIVLDSSASMPDGNEDISIPVLSSFIAKQSALSAGQKVAVMNFSSANYSVEFTRNNTAIDTILTLYQKGGTEIPGSEIHDLLNGNSWGTYVLVITDAYIANVTDQQANLEKISRSAGGNCVYLNSDAGETFENMGYNVVPMQTFDDLPNLVTRKMRDIYG